jgi:hypothetical protein
VAFAHARPRRSLESIKRIPLCGSGEGVALDFHQQHNFFKVSESLTDAKPMKV